MHLELTLRPRGLGVFLLFLLTHPTFHDRSVKNHHVRQRHHLRYNASRRRAIARLQHDNARKVESRRNAG